MKKRILVTGGAGFIGSFLCESLIKKGHYVICCDNFYTGNKENLNKISNHKNFELMRHDVTFPLYVEVDQIFNFACPASPIHYQNDPVQTVKTCVHGAINMLGLAKRTKARILQASTSEIYGDPEVHPQNESYKGAVSLEGPRACYDEGKRCAETIFWDYKRQHQIDVKVIRIFNTFGPRMQPNDGRVVSNFILQALANKDITVYGKGNQTRSFCYVDDLISGLIKLMDSNIDTPTNIGGIEEYKINKVAEIIRKKINPKISIINEPLPLDDPIQRKPNIQKAKSELGGNPLISFDDGLDRTIEYFQKEICS